MNTLAKKSFSQLPLLATLAALFLLFSCSKEEYEYPVVYTGEEFDMTEERIILSAYVPRMGSEDIIDYGFQINRYQEGWNRNPIGYNSPKISLQNTPLEEGSFTMTLQAGMVPNLEYELRAYATTSKGTSYGNIIRVINIVDNPLQLDYFEPEIAQPSDTISLYGRYFTPYILPKRYGWEGDENIVKFNEIKADVVFTSDTLLRVIVPNKLNEILSTISVELNDTVYSYKVPFSLSELTIIDFEPKEGAMNQEVTIYCNMDLSELSPSVHLADIEAQIISIRNSQMIVRVPETPGDS